MGRKRRQIKFERRLAAHELSAAQGLLTQAIAYERKLTDQQFMAVEESRSEHHTFHDREHILYDDAVDKASSALQAELSAVVIDVDRLRDTSIGFITAARFEREHASLIERIDTQFKTYDAKIGAEERVTVRQTTKDEVLQGVQTNNRWLVSLLIGNGLTLSALIGHLAHLF